MKKALAVLLVVFMVVTLAVPALAVDFSSSPNVVPIVDPGNGKGKRVVPIGDEDDPIEKKKIDDAIKEIRDADDISKLNDGVKDVINKNYEGLSVDDFRARDMFLIKIDDDAEKDADGMYKVNVGLNYTDSDITPIFLLRGPDGQWIIVEAVRNADNTFTLSVPYGGVIATFVPTAISAGGQTNKGQKTSPQTGAEDTMFAIVAVSAICLAGAAVVVCAKKKVNND